MNYFRAYGKLDINQLVITRKEVKKQIDSQDKDDRIEALNYHLNWRLQMQNN